MTRSPDNAHCSDAELMVRAAGGARDAFVSLIQRHQRGLVNYFRRMGVYNDAEDLVQETFMKLYGARARYRPSAKFTTFLYRIAENARIDFFRKNKRISDLQKKLRELPAARPKAVSVLGRLEIDDALGTLQERSRQVVVMKYFQGLKLAEIAEILQIPLGTVKSRMFHALRALGEVLRNE